MSDVRSVTKKIIYRISAKAPEKILPLLEGKSVVSFDVFDTLLKRDVAAPEDVFALMEQELRNSGRPGAEGFAELRKEAEKRAKQICSGREITLRDIYAQMPLDEMARRELMDTECRMELELSAPNLPVQQVYRVCLEQGKKVLFLSDMYLSAETVRGLLEKNGYSEGSLYVSSESGFTKRGGKLFEYVRELENIDKSRWLHIGDSILSDQMVPSRMGIRSVLIERDPHNNKYFDKKLYKRSADYRQLNHFINIHISRYTDPYEQIGYAVLGPLLYGFSCWLARTIPKDETIVFLAREGELLQRAFKVVSNRSSVYFYISRHAANLAYLDNIDDPETVLREEALSIRRNGTIKEMIKSFGLSDSDAQKALTGDLLQKDTLLHSCDIEKRVLAEIWPTVKKNTAGQHTLLQRYIEQLRLTERCAVVDVGWHGSIQSLLDKSHYTQAKKAIRWNGYYLGCIHENTSAGYDNIAKKGFLFDGEFNQYQYDGIRNSTPFFELLFLSTEGSTRRYREDAEGTVYPLHGEPENNKNTSVIISSLQNAGIQFVQDLHLSKARRMITMSADASGYNYQSLARVPSLSTLSLFGKFNSYNEYLYCLGSEHRTGYYLLHPKEFIREFAKKPGKTWFLKSVFKIPLPYISMVRLARKLTNNELAERLACHFKISVK